jgi:uncharacterized protein
LCYGRKVRIFVRNPGGSNYHAAMRGFKTAFFAFTGAFVFSLSPVFAQGTNRPAASGLHCLWEVQGKSNVVYLLGSVHVLRQQDYPLPSTIESAFTNSRIAVFEADADKAEEPEVRDQLVKKIMLPPGQTLQQVLSAKTYHSFSNHVDQAGLPMELFDPIKPGMAISMFEELELNQLGADPEYGLDKHFLKLARQTNRQVVFLETLDFQIDLITGFSNSEEELLVEKSLEKIDDEKKEYGELLTAWKKGDANGLEKMVNEMRTDAPAIFKKLVPDRTASWMPEVDKLLHGSQNAIVIVGAGHLVGSDGMVELLKKKGIKVTQL